MKTGVNPRHEAARQSFVLAEGNDMVYAPFPGYLHGRVLGAVVDDENFQLIDPVDLLGQMI